MQHLCENIVSMSRLISSLSCYRCSSISVNLCSFIFRLSKIFSNILCFVDRACRYIPTSTPGLHLKRTIITNCCIHTVVPPDDGHRYARNMYRFKKYTKHKFASSCIFFTRFQLFVRVNISGKFRQSTVFLFRFLPRLCILYGSRFVENVHEGQRSVPKDVTMVIVGYYLQGRRKG